MLEQRITRSRNEYLVTGIGQELEKAPVCLARACCQRDPLGYHVDTASEVIARDRRAGLEQAERRRGVRETSGIGQQAQKITRVIESRPRRIRFRQIENRPALGPGHLQRVGEPIGREVFRSPVREHSGLQNGRIAELQEGRF